MYRRAAQTNQAMHETERKTNELGNLKTGTKVMRQHRSPCWPVVRPLVAPNVKFIPDAFVVQLLCKPTAGAWIFIATATAQYMYVAALPDLF